MIFIIFFSISWIYLLTLELILWLPLGKPMFCVLVNVREIIKCACYYNVTINTNGMTLTDTCDQLFNLDWHTIVLFISSQCQLRIHCQSVLKYQWSVFTTRHTMHEIRYVIQVFLSSLLFQFYSNVRWHRWQQHAIFIINLNGGSSTTSKTC